MCDSRNFVSVAGFLRAFPAVSEAHGYNLREGQFRLARNERIGSLKSTSPRLPKADLPAAVTVVLFSDGRHAAFSHRHAGLRTILKLDTWDSTEIRH